MIARPSGWRSSQPVPLPSSSGSAPSMRSERGHQDQPEAQQRRLEDRLLGRLAAFALGSRRVDDPDRVLLDDADQQNDADDADHVEILAGDHQRQQRPDAGRGQRRQDRDGMNEALVQHAQHDVDGDEGGDQQEDLARQGILESLGGTQALSSTAASDRPQRLGPRRPCWRCAFGQVEGYGDRGKLCQMTDDHRHLPDLDVGDGGKRHLARTGRLGGQIERPQ